ncbi:MAG: hypothetical protein LQ342_002721 [Letrouitia transgressa]|nr:MAG: hypothetical protein LQ342_002721 [Letrouitia transgressa]
MIAGNNYNRNWSLSGPDPDTFTGPWNDDTNEQREQRATGFNCMNYGHNGAAAKNEPTLYRHHLPEKSWLDSNCPDGLRMELQFPSCWNGEMDGGKKHKSHVAYPNWINGGDCPKGFDKRLPSLMYETIVATDKFIGKSGKFVISNGDPTGYGYHGDFISAWDDGVLEQAVKQCTDMSGEMRTCGVFEFPDNTGSCTLESPLPPSIADENCDGPMSGLPAGMKIQSGPEPATPGPGGSTGSAASGSSHEGDSSAADSVSHLAPPADDYSSGGSGPDVGAAVVDEAASDVSPPPPTTTSPPPPPTHANDPNLNIYTDGRVVHENVVVTEHVTVTQGAARVKRSPEARAEHAKRHAHRHHHAGHAVGGRRLR